MAYNNKRSNKIEFIELLGANTYIQAAACVVGIALVRLMDKSAFGLYSFATSINNIVLLLNGMGCAGGILHFCSLTIGIDNPKRNAYYKYGINMGLIFNAALIILYTLFALFFKFKIGNIRGLLLLMAPMPVMQFLINASTNYLRVKGKTKEYALAHFYNSTLVLIFTIAGAYFASAAGAVYYKYVAYTIVFLVLFLKMKVFIDARGAGILSSADKADFNTFSIKTMLNSIITNLLYSIDVIVIGFLIADEIVLANYKTASIIPSSLVFIPLTLGLYIYPHFIKHTDDKKWLKVNYLKTVLLFGMFNLALTGALIVFAPLIIRLLFGNQYQDSVLIFRILCLGYPISATFQVFTSSILSVIKKNTANIIVGLIAVVLNVVLDYSFVIWFSVIGAAIATVISLLISSVLLVWYLLRYLNKNS